MNWNRRSFGKAALAIAVSGALSTGIMTTAFAATSLTGAGSTWVYPLVVKWSVAYEKETGTKVNYQGNGSNPQVHGPDTNSPPAQQVEFGRGASIKGRE